MYTFNIWFELLLLFYITCALPNKCSRPITIGHVTPLIYLHYILCHHSRVFRTKEYLVFGALLYVLLYTVIRTYSICRPQLF